MNVENRQLVESIQKMVARAVATHPVGRNLILIGGFRYRFLDESARVSDDIDYHWSGDLDEKQRELIAFFNRAVLPEVRRRLHYDGQATSGTGPDAESPSLRAVDLAFWREGIPYSRIEIPVELTRIVCADPVAVRTAGGTIYPTVSEADMIESKILAILNRPVLKHRDIVDVFLFHDRLLPDSIRRLAGKLKTLGIPMTVVKQKIEDLQTHKAYHARAVQEVIDTQLDPVAVQQIGDAGGGATVLERVMTVLNKHVLTGGRKSP